MAGTASIGDGSSSGSHAFSTQGQLSWTSLLSTTFSATVDVLSRVSAAGVDPYTVIVGQNLAAQFHLSAPGRQKMQDALLRLQSFRSLGTALSFGFGINHLVRVMGRTEEGLTCLALCASLTECYDLDVSAEVIFELVQLSRAPDHLRPSVLQWKDLLSSSSGIIATTGFSEFAETLMSLHPSVHKLEYEPRLHNQSRSCSSPESLAQALFAIAKVSRGELLAITLIGGADVGWLAAFAEWHLQLSVEITLTNGSSPLYQSQNGRDAQILVVYADNQEQDMSQIQTTNQTYRLNDIAKVIQKDHVGTLGVAPVTGRVPWETALHSTFGHDFKRLLGNRKALAGAVGSIARIFESKTTEINEHHQQVPSRCSYHEESSSGRHFIANLTDWFPELTGLRDTMEQEVDKDVDKCFAQYDAYISALTIACNCARCQGSREVQGRYCLVFILEAIIRMGRTLSIVDIGVPINPSRLGVETCYADQVRLHVNYEGLPRCQESHDKLGSSFFVLDEICLGVLPLLDALKIFSGRRGARRGLGMMGDDRITRALSKEGICAYWSSFGKALEGKLKGRVTIVPGQIQLNNRSYPQILDAQGSLGPQEVQDVLGWPPSLSCNDIELVVKETTTALRILFQIKGSEHQGLSRLRIRPTTSIQRLLATKARTGCRFKTDNCRRITDKLEVKEQENGYILYNLGGLEVTLFEATILQQWVFLNSSEPIVFMDQECVDCTIAQVVAASCQSADTPLIIRALED